MWEIFFRERVVKSWNRVAREAVELLHPLCTGQGVRDTTVPSVLPRLRGGCA